MSRQKILFSRFLHKVLLAGVFCSGISLVAAADTDSPRHTPTVRAVAEVLPAVANISTRELIRVSDPFESFFHDFFRGPTEYYRKLIPLGSGILIDQRGLIITNHHVVRRASNITVMLADNKNYRARLVAFDTANDLALLKLENGFTESETDTVEFGQPGDLLLGEPVVAVGNPFGLGSSVTTGVLSATNRSLREGKVVFDDIIQTDAAINPGNSGGPLINLAGQLIGMNLAIRQNAEGIGFAIPVARIEQVLGQWLIPSQFRNAILGLTLKPLQAKETEETKTVIHEIMPGSPADKAGLKPGDEITAVNSRKLKRTLNAGQMLWHLRAGDQVRMDLADGRSVNLKITTMNTAQLITRRLRLQVQELTPALKEALGLPNRLDGVAISDVKEQKLRKRGIRRGNVIYQINDTPVSNIQAIADILRKATPGDQLELRQFRVANFHGRLYLDQFSTRVIVR